MEMAAALRPRPRAFALGALLALGLMVIPSAPALAAPPAPTVHIDDGGDGFINAAEVGAVTVSGTTGVTVNRIRLRIYSSASCNTSALATAPIDVTVLAGTWTSGNVSLTGFPEGAVLCARALASADAGATYGDPGLSDNRPIKDTIVLAGTTRILDPNTDGFLNASEAASGIPAEWTRANVDATAARVWFKDETGATPCGTEPVAFADAASGLTSVAPTCAASLPEAKTFTFRARWTDAAGNLSAETISAPLKKDTIAPATPSLAIATDPINLANRTNVVVAGTTEANARLSITLTDQQSAPFERTTIASNTGTYFVTFDGTDLRDGTVTASGVAIDAASNVSPLATDTGLKDATPPAMPVVTITPDEVRNPNQTVVEVTVDGEAGTLVNLSVDDTSAGTAAITRTFTIDGNPATDDTVYVDIATLDNDVITATATLTDTNGNVSVPGTDTASKDLGATPVLTVTTPANGTILKSGSNVTVSGTATPGTTVTLYEDSDPLGSAVAATDGAWSINSGVLSDGFHTLIAIARTRSGNESVPVQRVIEIDPKIPTITSPAPNTLVKGIFQIGGIGMPNTTIEVFRQDATGSQQVGRTTVHPDGTWTTEIGSSSGTVVLKARGVDRNNTPSIFSDTLTVRVDSVRPTVKYVTPAAYAFLPDDIVRADGSATDDLAVDHVSVRIVNSTRGNLVAEGVAECTSGCGTAAMEWSFKPGNLLPGLYTVQATSVDSAGNASLAVSQLMIRA